jgi:hypothetical protein
MRQRAAVLPPLLVLAVLAVPASSRGQDRRFVVSAGGGLTVGTQSWTHAATWPVYQETARIESSHEAGSGPALEGAISYRIVPRVGVRAAYGWTRRDASADLHAEIPHPFFFQTPRTIDASLTGLDYTESNAYLDVELWPVTGGRLQVELFGGVALVSVDADLVDRVEYDEAYPFDEVTYRTATVSSASSDTAVGWSAGAAAVYTLASRWGLAAQLRYTSASVELTSPGSEATSIDAGGFRALAELRFGF